MKSVAEKLIRRELDVWSWSEEKADRLGLKVHLKVDDDTENLALWIRVFDPDDPKRSCGTHFDCTNIPDNSRGWLANNIADTILRSIEVADKYARDDIKEQYQNLLKALGVMVDTRGR